MSAARTAATAATSTAPKAGAAPTRALQRRCACGSHTAAGGECEECKKKRTLQRKGRGAAAVAPPSVHDVLRAPGAPLDAGTRAFMEPRLGQPLRDVRIHADGHAAQSAREVGADAYTVGRDIVFAAGRYAPGSPAGRELLAHELTHVLQQGPGRAATAQGEISVGPANDAFESQADQVAASIGVTDPGPLRSRVAHAGQWLQRAPAGKPAAASRGPAIVDDGQATAPGQMRRTEFLLKLRDTVTRACDAELAPFGRTSQGCPYIVRTVERYANRSARSVLRFVQLFGKASAGSDAAGLITAVTARARVVARNVGARRSGRLQASTIDGAAVPAHDPVAIQARLRGGRPLEAPTRRRMEGHFGASFAGVRVHADPSAAELSATLGARAFTVGHDVAFGAGQYQPGSDVGDALIAHELMHTLQQRAGAIGRAPSGDERGLERQADRAAASLTHPRAARPTGLAADPSGLRVQRWPAVIAGVLAVGEVGTEVVVVSEVAAVSTEVVLVDGAFVAAADVAAPAVAEVVLPAAVESVAPAAVSTLAPTAVSTTSAVSTLATGTTAIAVASTTLSSDSPTQDEKKDEKKKRRRCQQEPSEHPLPISWPGELP